MFDDLFKSLRPEIEPVTPDHFHDWKHHPVTIQFLHDMSMDFLDVMDEDLSEDSLDKVTIVALHREGARRFMEALLEWKPSHLVNEDDDEQTG